MASDQTLTSEELMRQTRASIERARRSIDATKRILDEMREKREGRLRPRLTLVRDEQAEVKDDG